MAVALYARVSTPRQADKDLSIPDQLRQMREHCKAQNLPIAFEYIEPGATATDDRRPVFQQMIADAGQDPAPYEAIIIHSRSRFFRDLFEFLGYERRLKRAGVRVISITQQTADDPAGEMASKIFSLFDEYQSKENGKHTLRAMQENARQGFCNGSRPHFGFRAVEAAALGNKGQRKKRLAIDADEAQIVRRIFELYLRGDQGASMGCMSIAYFLNERGITRRGQCWTRSRIHEVLANQAYVGQYYFNRIDGKTNKTKPPSDWVKLAVDQIVKPTILRRAQ
jgi:DNA invertase Pin-like site-specific DNA recombinase